jgi:3-oxoacyl-[acyl-carrier-protein] synthase-3
MVVLKRSLPTGRSARIHGIGAYLPRRVVANDDVAPAASADWIHHLTGISRRRRAGAGESLVEMSVAAAADALEAAAVRPDQVNCVIVASTTGPHHGPAPAASVAHRLGAHAAGAFDVSTACTGFCHALAAAADQVCAATARYVLVIGVERTAGLAPSSGATDGCLVGDGAAAVLVGPSAVPGVGPVTWGSDGAPADDRPMFRWACDRLPDVARRSLVSAGVTVDDLDAFIPHQANERLIDAWVHRLGLPDRVAVARTVREHACTASASIPLAMHDLVAGGKVRPGGLALLLGYGAGSTYAAQVVRLPLTAGRPAPAPGHPWTCDELLRRVERAVGVVDGAGVGRLGWDTRFDADLGGDALFVAQVVNEVEGELGVRIPDEALRGLRTAGELVERIRDHLAVQELESL